MSEGGQGLDSTRQWATWWGNQQGSFLVSRHHQAEPSSEKTMLSRRTTSVWPPVGQGLLRELFPQMISESAHHPTAPQMLRGRELFIVASPPPSSLHLREEPRRITHVGWVGLQQSGEAAWIEQEPEHFTTLDSLNNGLCSLVSDSLRPHGL